MKRKNYINFFSIILAAVLAINQAVFLFVPSTHAEIITEEISFAESTPADFSEVSEIVTINAYYQNTNSSGQTEALQLNIYDSGTIVDSLNPSNHTAGTYVFRWDTQSYSTGQTYELKPCLSGGVETICGRSLHLIVASPAGEQLNSESVNLSLTLDPGNKPTLDDLLTLTASVDSQVNGVHFSIDGPKAYSCAGEQSVYSDLDYICKINLSEQGFLEGVYAINASANSFGGASLSGQAQAQFEIVSSHGQDSLQIKILSPAEGEVLSGLTELKASVSPDLPDVWFSIVKDSQNGDEVFAREASLLSQGVYGLNVDTDNDISKVWGNGRFFVKAWSSLDANSVVVKSVLVDNSPADSSPADSKNGQQINSEFSLNFVSPPGQNNNSYYVKTFGFNASKVEFEIVELNKTISAQQINYSTWTLRDSEIMALPPGEHKLAAKAYVRGEVKAENYKLITIGSNNYSSELGISENNVDQKGDESDRGSGSSTDASIIKDNSLPKDVLNKQQENVEEEFSSNSIGLLLKNESSQYNDSEILASSTKNIKYVVLRIENVDSGRAKLGVAKQKKDSGYMWTSADLLYDLKPGKYRIKAIGWDQQGSWGNKTESDFKKITIAGKQNLEDGGKATTTILDKALEKLAPQDLSFDQTCEDAGIRLPVNCEKFLKFNELCIKKNIVNEDECKREIYIQTIPEECRQNKILNHQKCSIFLEEKKLPEQCQTNGIKDIKKCRLFLSSQARLTRECMERGIKTLDECTSFLENSIDKVCRDEGIKTIEGCKKYFLRKIDVSAELKKPEVKKECVDNNLNTNEKCSNYILSKHIPSECTQQNIYSPAKCDSFLQQKHLPKECKQNSISDAEECDNYIFKISAKNKCEQLGIEDIEDCRGYFINKTSGQVKCEEKEQWECDNFVREKFLGKVVNKQLKFEEIKERVNKMVGKSIKFVKGGADEKIIKVLPLANVKNKLKMVRAEEESVLSHDDEYVYTPSVAIMFDTDGDSLPDDVELRLGTDPNNVDTDGDGFSDKQELLNGYNPSGEGILKENALSPIDEAIIKNKIIEHPKLRGKINKALTIASVKSHIIKSKLASKNLEATSTETGLEENEYLLSGKAEANSVVSIYIYSDLPLVVTTRTDQYGNWKYDLKENLVDGEHEVYVAINDNTGRVVEKSNPLSFFVREAKAVSLDDFIVPAAAKHSVEVKSYYTEEDKFINYYIIFAFAGISLAVVVYLYILNRRKNYK